MQHLGCRVIIFCFLSLLVYGCDKNDTDKISNPKPNIDLLTYNKNNELTINIPEPSQPIGESIVHFSKIIDPKTQKLVFLKDIIDVDTFAKLYHFPADKLKVIDTNYLKNGHDIYYYKDKNYVYIFDPQKKQFFIASSIADYEVLGGCYLRAANKIYCDGVEVIQADINSFTTESKSLIPSIKDQQVYIFATDKNNIYWFSKNCNYDCFKNLVNTYYFAPEEIAKLKAKYFAKQAAIIPYSHIKDILYTDNKGNYYLQYFRHWRTDDLKHYNYESRARDLKTDKIIELKDIINAKEFHQINNSIYYSDNQHIYIAVESFATDIQMRILDLEPQKSQIIGNYIKDDNRIYFIDREVLGANAQEFNVFLIQETCDEGTLTTELGYDNNKIYYGNHELSYDDFVQLGIDEKFKAFLIKKYFSNKKQ